MSSYILYGSDGCHLCELAEDICNKLLTPEQLQLIDIVDDEKLVAAFGVHIPVLENTTSNAKLFWPFDQQQLAEFIS